MVFDDSQKRKLFSFLTTSTTNCIRVCFLYCNGCLSILITYYFLCTDVEVPSLIKDNGPVRGNPAPGKDSPVISANIAISLSSVKAYVSLHYTLLFLSFL